VPDLDLLRELAPPVEPPPQRTFTPPKRRRRPVLLLSPVAVGAVALALVLVLGQRGPTFAEAAIRAAQASPRLLVDGWRVTRVDEWDAGAGEMTFSAGGRTLELSWAPGNQARKDLEGVTRATVDGTSAFVGRYAGTDDYTALWRNVRARGTAPSAGAFLATLERIHQVSAREWLQALPASAVEPKAQAETTGEMLAGIPLPPGFTAPRATGETRDRYQLGAKVAGAVVCGWIERWLDGDRAAAAAALAGSRDWPLLKAMNAEGDYPEVVWQYADALNGQGTVPGGKLGLTVGGTYRDALGC
jgi:hypothetical protein